MIAVEPTFKRPEPEEWQRLYAAAETAIQGLHDGSQEGLAELGATIYPLGRVAIINNSYYASGFAVCNLARQLSDPAVQNGIIDNGARMLIVGTSDYHREGGVSAFNTSSFPLDEAFEPALDDAYDSTDERVRLLGNYLFSVRRIKNRERDFAPAPHSPEMVEHVYEQMRGIEEPMLKNRLHAISISPPDIIDTILRQRGIDLRAGQLPRESDIAGLRHPSVIQLARRLCTLTSAESKGICGQVIDARSESVEFTPPVYGRPNFFSSSTTITNEDDDFQVEKTTPMICPALHVQGIVPLVMDLTINILESAAREARLKKTGFKVYSSLEDLLIP